MNYNEALLAKLDKIIEKMETFENIVSNIEQKLQHLTNANDSNNFLNQNINLSSSSSGNKLDSDHSWNLSTDLKYRQGITPDQRKRENRQNNLYRSSSQGSGISLRQAAPHQQNEIRRTNKPSRPSSTDNNNKSNIASNVINTKSNITNNNLNNSNANTIDNKKKVILTPQKTENKSPNKTETSPSQQQQSSPPTKTRNAVVFFPDDDEDDLQFDED